MGVLLLAILQRELSQEALPLGAPPGVLDKPGSCRTSILCFEELPGKRIELASAIELGAGGRASLHRFEHVEEASLDARGRPDCARRLGEAG